MLRKLLSENKSLIVNAWTQLIIESYASETSKFLKLEKDQFNNPVGHIITKNAEAIFDEIIKEENTGEIISLLDDIVKIRAVQDFPPSIAVNFIYLLKKVIKDKLADEMKDKNLLNEYLDFDLVIDQAALTAFNLYMNAREKIFSIRVNELKSKPVITEA